MDTTLEQKLESRLEEQMANTAKLNAETMKLSAEGALLNKTVNYGTDSELIQEASREKQARQAEVKYIQNKLLAAEKSDFVDKGRDAILAGFKDRLRANGEL